MWPFSTHTQTNYKQQIATLTDELSRARIQIRNQKAHIQMLQKERVIEVLTAFVARLHEEE